MSVESDPVAPGLHPLPTEADQAALRTRIRDLQSRLSASFVAKNHIARLVVVSAIAGEPLLLVGAPGSGKSAIVKRFAQLLDVPGESYFEYILTPNTTTSELSRPASATADVAASSADRLAGADALRPSGTLMSAQVVFLDEVFHANSSVLNALIYRLGPGGLPMTATASGSYLGLNLVVAATTNLGDPLPNELLLDRFTLQSTCDTVNRDHFSGVIQAGIQSELSNAVGHSPGHADCTIPDFVTANRCVQARLASTFAAGDGWDLRQTEGYADFERLVPRLRREDRVFISDRKLIKLYKLLATAAWLDEQTEFSRSTLQLLSFIGNTMDEMQILAEKVPLLLGQLE